MRVSGSGDDDIDGDGGVGGSTNFEAENGIRTGELFNVATAVPEMFIVSLSMVRSDGVAGVAVVALLVVAIKFVVASELLFKVSLSTSSMFPAYHFFILKTIDR